ncbi:unnamed protein product [Soboliphyme baturini]|uniref:WH1 domain-containing protein n=1 Tax=Soboliphyme baturini TaxID=241478 RepID=A0A183IU66_9BILA|nr:unnamed protein product [Soboliphyme baturini]
MEDSSNSSGRDDDQANGLLADQELFKVELMYTSRTSKAFVCSCLANLYQKRSGAAPAKAKDGKEWFLVATGIPVLVAELRETRNGGPPTCVLQMRMTEYGTGFTLWMESLDQSSRYIDNEPGFHTVEIKKNDDSNLTVGLSFDNPVSARNFFHRFKIWQTECRNSAEVHRSGRKGLFKHSITVEWPMTIAGLIARQRLPVAKSSISGPCFFRHVTSLRPHDILNHSQSFVDQVTTLPSSFKSHSPDSRRITQHSMSLHRNSVMEELKERSYNQ